MGGGLCNDLSKMLARILNNPTAHWVPWNSFSVSNKMKFPLQNLFLGGIFLTFCPGSWVIMKFHCHLKEAGGKGKQASGGTDVNGVAEEMQSHEHKQLGVWMRHKILLWNAQMMGQLQSISSVYRRLPAHAGCAPLWHSFRELGLTEWRHQNHFKVQPW